MAQYVLHCFYHSYVPDFGGEFFQFPADLPARITRKGGYFMLEIGRKVFIAQTLLGAVASICAATEALQDIIYHLFAVPGYPLGIPGRYMDRTVSAFAAHPFGLTAHLPGAAFDIGRRRADRRIIAPLISKTLGLTGQFLRLAFDFPDIFPVILCGNGNGAYA